MSDFTEKIKSTIADFALMMFSVLSLVLGICFLKSRNYESAANFFAAFGALVASVVTLRVARSADETAKNSLSISESMRDLEIKSESPYLRIINVQSIDISGTCQSIIIGVRNFGTTTAFDCVIQNDYFENSDLLNLPTVFPQNLLDDHTYCSIYCKVKKEVLENKFNGDYFLTYETIFGHKFRLEFSISKNEDDTRGYYIINSQKLILEK